MRTVLVGGVIALSLLTGCVRAPVEREVAVGLLIPWQPSAAGQTLVHIPDASGQTIAVFIDHRTWEQGTGTRVPQVPQREMQSEEFLALMLRRTQSLLKDLERPNISIGEITAIEESLAVLKRTIETLMVGADGSGADLVFRHEALQEALGGL